MTSSQYLDLGILAIAFVAAISGWRSGALGSLLSVVVHVEGTRTRLFITLFLILGLVVVGEIAGVVLGRAVRGAIRSPGIRAIDSVIGVGVMVMAVAVVAYLLATPLTSTNQPNLVAAVRGSKVLTQVDEIAPPWLKAVPNRLKD